MTGRVSNASARLVENLDWAGPECNKLQNTIKKIHSGIIEFRRNNKELVGYNKKLKHLVNSSESTKNEGKEYTTNWEDEEIVNNEMSSITAKNK